MQNRNTALSANAATDEEAASDPDLTAIDTNRAATDASIANAADFSVASTSVAERAITRIDVTADASSRRHRPLDWRWQAACQVQSSSSDPGNVQGDFYLERATRFLEIRTLDGQQAAEEYDPIIAAAEALRADAGVVAALKRFVLAYVPNTDISEQMGIRPLVLDCWKALFFDVTGRKEDEILRCVIEPEQRAGNNLAARRLCLAYVAGPAAARVIINIGQHETEGEQLLPYDEGVRLFHRRVQLARDWKSVGESTDSSLGPDAFFTANESLMRESYQYDSEVIRVQDEILAVERRHRPSTSSL